MNPICAILGPRQCGKTTLAKAYIQDKHGVTYFDLENPRDLARLADPMLGLESLEGLVVIDEIQRIPELFPVLRVLADTTTTQYLILGSASKELIAQSSESLAGRISYIELSPFYIAEVEDSRTLWQRGGFPRSYLATSDETSFRWRENYITNLLERDIPQLGVNLPAASLRRFWMMLTHYHGNILNAAELGRSFGVSHTTIKKHLDVLASTFMIRLLQPWHENISKRQVKSPKVYIRDSGLLHTLLGVNNNEELQLHRFLGASWEGYALEQVILSSEAKAHECFFWATHSGSECDLVIVRNGKKVGYEFKYSSTPKVTKSMHSALETLSLEKLICVVPGDLSYQLSADGIEVMGIENLLQG